MKRQSDKSASSDLGTDVKVQNRRSSRNSLLEREGKTDKKHSSSKQRVKDHTRGTSARSSSATSQGHSDLDRANVNSQPDEAYADDRLSFSGVLMPPLLIGSAEYNQVNPSLGDAHLQNQSALMVISRSSQDNLKACAGNTAELMNMFVPPPFTPPRLKLV